jgi:hypothetical protein
VGVCTCVYEGAGCGGVSVGVSIHKQYTYMHYTLIFRKDIFQLTYCTVIVDYNIAV